MVGNEDIKTSSAAHNVRFIAFYLTQFHPIPENDLWWGTGFTEWTNVTKATPVFDGHYQPHLPADLGFYDLRLKESRHQQIELAKRYGIDGFCYYYYWFSGKRLLERPLEDMLHDPESDMPFCLCWANENWSRRWDAAESEVLIAQQYLPGDDLAFIKSLIPYFNDRRYIKINGAPLLIVYRPQHLPDPKKSAQVWRDYCKSIGIEKIHLHSALTHGNWDYEQFDFDGGVEFPPHNMKQDNLVGELNCVENYQGYVVDYSEVAKMYLANDYSEKNVYRCLFPSWDNTARRKLNGAVIINGTPENYECWLSSALKKTKEEYPNQERILFINAWNEWAEGCHLEPDRRYGHQFLDVTKRVKLGKSSVSSWTHIGVSNEIKRVDNSNLVSRLAKIIRAKIRQL